jgi:hypothetical protein
VLITYIGSGDNVNTTKKNTEAVVDTNEVGVEVK